jgi:hypothetical protein
MKTVKHTPLLSILIVFFLITVMTFSTFRLIITMKTSVDNMVSERQTTQHFAVSY